MASRERSFAVLSYCFRRITSNWTFSHKRKSPGLHMTSIRSFSEDIQHRYHKTKNIASKWIGGTGAIGLSSAIISKLLPVSEAKSNADDHNFIADVVEKASPAVVFLENEQFFGRSGGSGFIIHEDGVIVTNAHVVARKPTIQIKLQDGSTYTGHVQYISEELDLATVKINTNHKLPTLELADSKKVRPGEWVIAMGSPYLLNNSVTVGIVSAVNRASQDLGMGFSDMDYIQTDASISPGNSGGPLVNLDGKVVGVSRMKLHMASIGFAIPAEYVKEFLIRAENSRNKENSRGVFSSFTQKKMYLGVSTITLTPPIAWELNRRGFNWMSADLQGVLVVEVHQSSPAYRAGIRPYDVIISINGEKMRTSQNVHQGWNTDSLLISLIRDGQQIRVKATPE